MMPFLVWNSTPATNDHYEHYLELKPRNFRDDSNNQKIVCDAGYTVFDVVKKETIADRKVNLLDSRCGTTLFWLVAGNPEERVFSFPQVQVDTWDFHSIQWKSATRMLSFRMNHPFAG
jgi:hypothetical protein